MEFGFEMDMLSRRVARLKSRLLQVQDMLAARDEAGGVMSSLPRSLGITADRIPEFSQGFYQIEHNSSGQPFRWTGDGPFFELRCALDRRQEQQLHMRLRAYPPRAIDELKLYVDYVEAAIHYDYDDEFTILRARVFPEPLSVTTIITVHTPMSFVPHSLNPGIQDFRSLAVMFYAMELGTAVAEPAETAAAPAEPAETMAPPARPAGATRLPARPDAADSRGGGARSKRPPAEAKAVQPRGPRPR